VQSISGTGAIRLGFEFIKHFYEHKDCEILIPDPTWPIHKTVNDRIGLKWSSYRYYDSKKKAFDFDGMLVDLGKAKDYDCVLLHVCAHNPTGQDPS
jgi:aspartate/tyrosine/aromatic aminotransferase